MADVKLLDCTLRDGGYINDWHWGLGSARRIIQSLTSKAGDMSKYQEFLANETRYSRLARAFPDRAKELFEKNQEVADARYTHLTKLVDLYK